MADAARQRFDVLRVWAVDRLARSVKQFLELLDELNRLHVEFVSFRENLDMAGPLGRAIIVIVSVVAELEKALIVERVRAGMRRAKLEGRRMGRRPLELDHAAILRDRARGLSLGQLAKLHRASRTTPDGSWRVCREGLHNRPRKPMKTGGRFRSLEAVSKPVASRTPCGQR